MEVKDNFESPSSFKNFMHVVRATRYRQVVEDSSFETISYADIEVAEQEEFEYLLHKVCSHFLPFVINMHFRN